MKILFFFLGVSLISSCKKTTCNAIRYDYYITVEFTNGNDTFIFDAYDLPNDPTGPPSASTLDSINKIKQMGYRILHQTVSVYEFIDCDKCSKILQYHPGNLCIENK